MCDQLILLSQTEKEEIATTLIILPDFDQDFDAYLDLLYAADNILERIGLRGVLQLASFILSMCLKAQIKTIFLTIPTDHPSR